MDSAPNSPQKTATLLWEGRLLPMEYRASGWRLRSRLRHCIVNFSTNCHQLKAAQRYARKHLEKMREEMNQPTGRKTLEDVIEAYRTLPKRAGRSSEAISISRLRAVALTVTGRKPDKILATEIDARFWLNYIAKKQGRVAADLGALTPQNAAINSAMRTAAAVFKESLLPLYAELGIVFRTDVTSIQWLPRLKVPPPAARGADLLAAWAALKNSDPGMWQAIGLARFAGLRRNEAMAAAKHWVETEGDVTYIRLCVRPEENFRTKTGENYRAMVINPDVAAWLREAPPGLLVQPSLRPPNTRPMTREVWFRRKPQAWAKPFTGTAKKPLHRLRGLYLDDVAKLTEDAVAARLAGVRAAADAAGHTSTKTTEDHYLTR